MKFRFLEDIATADAAFEAYGRNLAELFENAALALFEVMVETKKVNPVTSYKLQVTSSNLEDLLFDFLSELVFLKDKQEMVLSKFKVKIEPKLESPRCGRLPIILNPKLKAWAWGEKINPQKHNLKVDVKAVTRHLFEIRKEGGGFIARVVLDV